jgi:hypothetical protein
MMNKYYAKFHVTIEKQKYTYENNHVLQLTLDLNLQSLKFYHGKSKHNIRRPPLP